MAANWVPASRASASCACNRSATDVVWVAVRLWPGQRFTSVPNKAAGWPHSWLRCSIRWVVVVFPLVPVTPISPKRVEGCCQNADASSPAQTDTGSGNTRTASPETGGWDAAACSPIRTAAAPAARACGQKLPPSTLSPGRPMNKLPSPTQRESQVSDVTVAFARPEGTGKPAAFSRAWSICVITNPCN